MSSDDFEGNQYNAVFGVFDGH